MVTARLSHAAAQSAAIQTARLSGFLPAGTRPHRFYLPFSSTDLLGTPSSITINGTSRQAALEYVGNDATLSAWPASLGTDLPIAGTGADFALGVETPIVESVVAATAGAGKYFSAYGGAGAIGTMDAVFEVVFKGGSTFGTLLSYTPTNGGRGWQFKAVTTSCYLLIRDGTNQAVINTGGIVSGSWNVVHIAIDRSGSARIVQNGGYGGSYGVTSVGDIDNGTLTGPAIGGCSNGTERCNGTLALARVWEGASWLDTHLQDALFLRRCSQIFGLMASKSAGSVYPTAMSRTSGKTIYHGAASFVVGAHWISVSTPQSGTFHGVEISTGDTLTYDLSGGSYPSSGAVEISASALLRASSTAQSTIVSVSDGTANNRASIGTEATTGRLQCRVRSGGGAEAVITSTLAVRDGVGRSFRLLLDGGVAYLYHGDTVIASGAATAPVGVSAMNVGTDYAGGNPANGWINAVGIR